MPYLAFKRLIEQEGQIQDSPSDAPVFGPTPKFHKIYGNYCGPGNQGGAPIDDLDAACMKHDKCYFNNGRDDCDCDTDIVNDVREFMKNGKLRFKQRMYAELIRMYFEKKNKRASCN